MLQFWVNDGTFGKKWHCLCKAEGLLNIFQMSFANDNAKFSETVFVVLKFRVIETNLGHKLHFWCITQSLLKVL